MCGVGKVTPRSLKDDWCEPKSESGKILKRSMTAFEREYYLAASSQIAPRSIEVAQY